MPIPEILKSLLGKLTDEDAETVWVWLDETENVVDLLIEHGIAATHPALEEKICARNAEDELEAVRVLGSIEIEIIDIDEVPKGFKPRPKPQ